MLKKFLCGLVALSSFGFLLLGADEAFAGAWKIDVTKSTFAQRSRSKGHDASCSDRRRYCYCDA